MQTIKNIFFYFPVKLINISHAKALPRLQRGLIGTIDKLLKITFLPKTLKHYDSLGRPYGVIISDDLLKFHDNDIRKQIKKELLTK